MKTKELTCRGKVATDKLMRSQGAARLLCAVVVLLCATDSLASTVARPPIPSGKGTEECVYASSTDAPSSSADSVTNAQTHPAQRDTNAQVQSVSTGSIQYPVHAMAGSRCSATSSIQDPSPTDDQLPMDFSATLKLALLSKNEHIKNAVGFIAQKNYSAALSQLAAAEKGDYPWRVELTNGYQHGFVLCAMKGYCLEQVHDPPKAYRQYQNSLAHMDEDDAQFFLSDPRIEAMIGIGRMCNAVGRYNNSFNWLDISRMALRTMAGNRHCDMEARRPCILWIENALHYGGQQVYREKRGHHEVSKGVVLPTRAIARRGGIYGGQCAAYAVYCATPTLPCHVQTL